MKAAVGPRQIMARVRRLGARTKPLPLGRWLGACTRFSSAAASRFGWRRRISSASARAVGMSTNLVAVVGLQFEARIIAGPSVRSVFLGMEAGALAASFLDTDNGVISFGICGGLDPGLRPGDCIVASCILDGKRVWPTDKAWATRLMRAIPGAIHAPILGLDSPVLEVVDKRRLHQRHFAAAVDMESHLAASAASFRGLPFVAVRVVADDARCRLLEIALAGRRSDGSVSASAVLRALLEKPAELAPLIRLAAHAGSARTTLLRLRTLCGDHLAFPGFSEPHLAGRLAAAESDIRPTASDGVIAGCLRGELS
jgi:hopanoid-associated phosphorylase